LTGKLNTRDLEVCAWLQLSCSSVGRAGGPKKEEEEKVEVIATIGGGEG